MAENSKQVQKAQEPVSVRFMNMVIKEFTSAVDSPALTNFQKRLAQNYFMAVDVALAKAEQKRNDQKNKLPITWANVNLQQLALDVVACARVGLDPAQPNHVHPVPYKNNTTNKYDIAFIPGYRGLEMKATKYGLDVPDAVIVELVHKNDKFKPIKKDARNAVENYEFEITNPFDRGEVVGGFYYHIWANHPEKNKLVIFSIQDILKRKPAYASKEFWGEEGWYEKMCWKTIYRAAYKDITIDSQKIDDDYLRLKQMEDTLADEEVAAEIAENANQEVIDIDDIPAENAEKQPEKEQKEGNPVQMDCGF